MHRYRLLVLGTVVIAAAAFWGAAGLERGPSSQAASPQLAGRLELATSRHAGQPSGVAQGHVDQASLRQRGTFGALRGGNFSVYEGELLRGSSLSGPGEVDPVGVPRKKCVILRGHGFATLACAHDPFLTSTLLFVESSSGGPEGRDRTEFQIAGLAAPQVARILAVDSTGRTRDVRISPGHAFFVELSATELQDGITIRSFRALGASGELLEDVNA